MPLTPEQEAQLAELEAERVKPQPRTESGLAGVFHKLLDVASGAVAHFGPEVWQAARVVVESELGAQDQAASSKQDAAAKQDDAGSSSSSSSSSGKAGKS